MGTPEEKSTVEYTKLVDNRLLLLLPETTTTAEDRRLRYTSTGYPVYYLRGTTQYPQAGQPRLA